MVQSSDFLGNRELLAAEATQVVYQDNDFAAFQVCRVAEESKVFLERILEQQHVSLSQATHRFDDSGQCQKE